MKIVRTALAAALLATSFASAWAQATAASAPRPAGSGPRMGMGPRAMAGADFTPGWAMMNRQERDAHRERMRAMQSPDDCRAYLDKHREEMAARAKERGVPMRGPRRDACAALKR